MKWFATAPANLALIKYMGKRDTQNNIPSNSSLSYTLDHLCSFVELELSSGTEDIWEPLEYPNCSLLDLTPPAIVRFLAHLSRLKKHFAFQGNFIVRSANDFPPDCGLASSASSFAALTKAGVTALSALTAMTIPDVTEQARLSQLGSGSSCRSFFEPWALWSGEKVMAVELPYEKLLHMVVVVDAMTKKVSSSSAHQRVSSSSLFIGRGERAEQRLEHLIHKLQVKEWEAASVIVWQEFWDMHALFETANPPFGYMTPDSLHVLQAVREVWLSQGDGPIATMDAGPNVHLLFRPDQQHLFENLKLFFAADYQLI
ncbi:diphosphomevalonate decarboxylase [soil metagenome]